MIAPVFAAAQCTVRAGDLADNLRRHLVFMRAAHRRGVHCLVFPELSLTGYELDLADDLAQAPDSPLLAPLRAYAREARMTTIVGLPLRSASHDRPLIGAVVLHADGTSGVHTKQHLHTGEDRYVDAGAGGALLRAADLPLALAICADFCQPAHAAAAAQAGARLYAASVLIGNGGYPVDSAMLQGHARRHGMAVLMANHGGPTGGWTSAGRSAFWDEDGRLVAAVPGTGDRLLVATRTDGRWDGFVEPVTAPSTLSSRSAA
jgi:predicted amidohydrolase